MQKDVCDQQINRYTLMIHPCHVNAIYVIRTDSVKQQICRSSISPAVSSAEMRILQFYWFLMF